MEDNCRKNAEVKQAFLASAISDISTYIQLTDTKVSIIMGAIVALLAGILACYDPIYRIVRQIVPCSWLGVCFCIAVIVSIISVISVFVFGILTIRGHASAVDYKSKWFLAKDTKAYSLDAYLQDLKVMDDLAVIENMGVELYKLNDINRQKAKTMKWALYMFSTALIAICICFGLLLVSLL